MLLLLSSTQPHILSGLRMKTPPGNTLGGQCLRNAEKQARRSWEVISYVYPLHVMQISSRTDKRENQQNSYASDCNH